MSIPSYHLLSEQVQQYVQSFFETNFDERLLYHNLAHTQGVANAAGQIADHYQLNDRDFFVVQTAAWFHDIGYFIEPSKHEEQGAELAEIFLKTLLVDDATILSVKNCILATQMPQHPTNLLEQIVCDADLFHFGTDKCLEKSKLLRKEISLFSGKEISKADWRTGTIAMLQNHQYFTDYCQLLLADKQQENLDKLLAKQEITVLKSAKEHLKTKAIQTQETQLKEKKKTKPADRGIDNVFKITSSNNQRLSSQADSKAHIMIQVNSIIISVLLSMLLRKLEEYSYLTIPAIMLLSVNVITIIFSVLATRPQIPKGVFTKADIDAKEVNLLFFGNFYRMGLEDYSAGMQAMINESDFLYNSLIKDVYFSGKVLGRKYHLLRFSYNVFMFGLIASVLAFIIASFFFR